MHWTPGILYERDGDVLECTMCPFRCRLGPGQTGQCHVRRHGEGGIETATFASSVTHADPIERKPLYHFRPGSQTVTLAAPGCTFRCNYCVNHRASQYGRSAEAPWTASPVDPNQVAAQAATANACVALSYTEPGLAVELTLALAAAGADIVWKSNGFLTPETVTVVAPVLAAVNIDLKAADERAHQRLTGAPLAPVIDTIAELRRRGVWVEVSTPLIPTISAEPFALTAIAEMVAGIDPAIPWHLLRFTPAYRMRRHDPTPPAALAEGVRRGRAAGLRHVYVERALGGEGRSTRCPACDTVVIRRDVWRLAENLLRGGTCRQCGTPVEGQW